MTNEDHLHKAFAFFDQNQSGYIEIEEIRNALAEELSSDSEEVINAIMHDVDTDKVRVLFTLIISCLVVKHDHQNWVITSNSHLHKFFLVSWLFRFIGSLILWLIKIPWVVQNLNS